MVNGRSGLCSYCAKNNKRQAMQVFLFWVHSPWNLKLY